MKLKSFKNLAQNRLSQKEITDINAAVKLEKKALYDEITVKRKHRDYKENLLEALKNPEEALAYLNAAVQDPDPRILELAINDIANANIPVSNLPQI